MDTLLQDLRFASRSLRKRPAFTAVIVLTLALATGANTAVFTILDGMLLRPLPLAEPEGLLAITARHQTLGIERGDLSFLDVRDLAAQCTVCTAVEGFDDTAIILGGGDRPQRVESGVITPGLFDLLGVQPVLGRSFLPAEGEPGGEPVVILSDGLWRRRFGGDAGVVGRTVRLNGRDSTVVGVMPPGFRFPEAADAWIPFVPPPDASRAARYLEGTVTRLRPDADPARLAAELEAIAGRLAAAYPDTNAGWVFAAQPLRELTVKAPVRALLLLMAGAVGFVLLIACANVANLLLSRQTVRRRELAIRVALGSSGWRLARQLLTESLLLALAGGALGVLLASWMVDLTLLAFPEDMPYWVSLEIDGEVLLFTLGVTLLTGLLFGSLPAWQASRPHLDSSLREGAHGAGHGRQRQALQRGLVAAEIALAVVLLCGAVLFVKSFLATLRGNAGFDTAQMLTLRTVLIDPRYDEPALRAAFLQEAAARIAALLGVEGAAFTGAIPIDDGSGRMVLAPEGDVERMGEELLVTYVTSTTDFFATLGVPLYEGRTFTDAEGRDPETEVAVINRALAERLWPGERAAGRRIRLGRGAEAMTMTVVGVAPDVQYEEFGEESASSRLQVHLPYARQPWRGMALLVRTAGAPGPLRTVVEKELAGLDADLAIYETRTMDEVRRTTTWGQRFVGQIFGSFALMALLLGALGVYGVMAFAVSQRVREIGIRMALGADRSDVSRMVLGEALLLAAAGIGLGVAGALATTSLLRGMLYGVSATDPATLVLAPLVLLGTALLASYLPARRAAAIEPALTLRAD